MPAAQLQRANKLQQGNDGVQASYQVGHPIRASCRQHAPAVTVTRPLHEWDPREPPPHQARVRSAPCAVRPRHDAPCSLGGSRVENVPKKAFTTRSLGGPEPPARDGGVKRPPLVQRPRCRAKPAAHQTLSAAIKTNPVASRMCSTQDCGTKGGVRSSRAGADRAAEEEGREGLEASSQGTRLSCILLLRLEAGLDLAYA